MIRRLLKRSLLWVMLVGVGNVYAQKVVSGSVTSSEDKSGIPGATVVVKGTNNGVVTSVDGGYRIEVGNEAVLVFSFLGYESQEITVGAREIVDVSLAPSSTQLAEVVVVAYGTQDEKTLSGSVSAVKGAEVIKSPSINVSNSLAGRVPGLVAVGQSGEPGADGSTLLVRGLNTLNSTNGPLIVVDGVPFRSLDRIDPATIESISVIKDASAAIYGSLAANGVILVTTKRGKSGQLQVSANFNYAVTQPTRIPELTNSAEWAVLFNEMINYDYVVNKPKYTPAQIAAFRDGTDPWRYPNTDWFDTVLKKWSSQNYTNIAVSGGTDKMKIYTSISNRFQDGFFKNSASFYRQNDLRMSIEANPNDYLDISVGLTGRLEDRNFPTRGSSKIFGELVGTAPIYQAVWPDGRIGPATDQTDGSNPVANSTPLGGYDESQNYVFNFNSKATLRIPWVEGLSVSGTAAIDRGFMFSKYFTKPLYLNFWDKSTVDANGIPVLTQSQTGGSPKLNQRQDLSGGYLINLLLNYEKTLWDNHNIRILGGIERLQKESSYMTAYRDGFAGTSVDELLAGDGMQTNNGASPGQDRWQNYFGRVNYTFKDKYLLEYVWRYQGSSKFAQEIRYGFFQGISAGYRISDENFWKENISFINSFKIRGSTGKTGSDFVPPYQFMSVYGIGYFNFVTTDPGTGALIHNNTVYESVVPSRNYTWEEAFQTNVGVDMELIKNQLSITADYFNNYRTKILITKAASVPGSTGFAGSLPPENIGKVRNKGVDFNVTYKGAAGRLTYQVGVNGVYAKNRVIDFGEQPGLPDYQKVTGFPLFTDAYYIADGIYRTQEDVDKYPSYNDLAERGDVIFEDVNGDGVINSLDKKRMDKNGYPRLSMGLNLSAQYKGFDLSILIQGATGAVRYVRTTSGSNGNFLKSFYDKRWSVDNPNAEFPRTYSGGTPYWVGSDTYNTFWLRKTDYVRLKNVELGYSLPAAWVQRVKMQQLRVYFSGLNLLTYAPALKDFGTDPEMQPQGDGFNGQGYPLQKVLNMGINVTF